MPSEIDRTVALIAALRRSADEIREIAAHAIEERDVDLLIAVVCELLDSVDSLVSLSGLAAAELAIDKEQDGPGNSASPGFLPE